MKTEIKIPNETQKELKFPLLARNKTSGDIYRFVNFQHAVIMLTPDGTAATKRECWFDSAPVTDSHYWEILPPGTTLTLIQE